MKKIAVVLVMLSGLVGIISGADLYTAPMVSDSRYSLKISTCATGRILADGIIQANFGVTYARFVAKGSSEMLITSTNTIGLTQTMYIQPSDIREMFFDIPVSGKDNDFTVDLTSGDTLYYTITGVK